MTLTTDTNKWKKTQKQKADKELAMKEKIALEKKLAKDAIKKVKDLEVKLSVADDKIEELTNDLSEALKKIKDLEKGD